MATSTARLNDAIPGDRAEQLANDLQHSKSRAAIREVVEDYISSSAFADRVKSIQLEALEADPARDKLKFWVNDVVGKVLMSEAQKTRQDSQIDARITAQLDERGWKKKNFWVPTWIGIGALVVTLITAIFTYGQLQEAKKANEPKSPTQSQTTTQSN
jgi:hypothetical protein